MASNTEARSLPTQPDNELYFDVIIIGAGISGINTAYRIQNEGPANLSYAILEGRDSIGGTWDLFRYPGIRSDSDIFTFGFPWSPWKHKEILASGTLIKEYIEESAESAGINHHICFQHSVISADWSSEKRSWKLNVARPGQNEPAIFRAQFLVLGTGYYDYKTPLQAIIPGIDNFRGQVIHPQFWPENFDYTGKDVVVIGSGVTAITILPSMSDKAKRVTMLQRSPGYIFSVPSSSILARLLFAVLPMKAAYFLNSLIWVFTSYMVIMFCRSCPELAKVFIKKATIKQLPPDVQWDPHFKPRYNPWEQRFCACLNGDFFAAIRSGKAGVVTDEIKTVTETGIELKSGASLHPDVIVTATGLKLMFGGGIRFTLNGHEFKVGDKFAWKTAMLQDTPNLFFVTGYENASWTLGADVNARLFVRIMSTMRDRKATIAVPRVSAREPMDEKPMLSLSSTYVKKAGNVLPKAGTGQWTAKSNYFADMAGAKWGDISTDLELL